MSYCCAFMLFTVSRFMTPATMQSCHVLQLFHWSGQWQLSSLPVMSLKSVDLYSASSWTSFLKHPHFRGSQSFNCHAATHEPHLPVVVVYFPVRELANENGAKCRAMFWLLNGWDHFFSIQHMQTTHVSYARF